MDTAAVAARLPAVGAHDACAPTPPPTL